MSRRSGGSRGGPRYYATPLIAIDRLIPLDVQKFLDERVGMGRHAMDDFGLAYITNTRLVTTTADNGNDNNPTPGSLRAALKGNAKKLVIAAPGLTGSISPPNRSNQQIPMGSNTLANLGNLNGPIEVGINPIGQENYVLLNATIRNLFSYSDSLLMGSDHMGFNMSNARNAYGRWLSISGTGDACFASGSYSQQRNFDPPYGGTMHDVRITPMTEYPLMAPIPLSKMGPNRGEWSPTATYTKFDMVTVAGSTWFAAGDLPAMAGFDRRYWFCVGVDNALDNWWTNAKGANNAYDHNKLVELFGISEPKANNANFKREPKSSEQPNYDNMIAYRNQFYSNACTVTWVDSMFTSGSIRNPKFKGQNGDLWGCAILKYGHSHLVTAGNQSGMGGGVSCEDEARMRISGCVWVPCEDGEEWLPMRENRALALGVPVTRVKRDAVNFHPSAISQEGDSTGTCYIDSNNWLPRGVSVAAAKAATGQPAPVIQAGISSYSDWARDYPALAVADVTTEAGALAKLESLRLSCGNRNRTVPEADWRTVHSLRDGLGNLKLTA